eukprot:11168530-Ditylum_brightwellii.AAC.2
MGCSQKDPTDICTHYFARMGFGRDLAQTRAVLHFPGHGGNCRYPEWFSQIDVNRRMRRETPLQQVQGQFNNGRNAFIDLE